MGLAMEMVNRQTHLLFLTGIDSSKAARAANREEFYRGAARRSTLAEREGENTLISPRSLSTTTRFDRLGKRHPISTGELTGCTISQSSSTSSPI